MIHDIIEFPYGVGDVVLRCLEEKILLKQASFWLSIVKSGSNLILLG